MEKQNKKTSMSAHVYVSATKQLYFYRNWWF